MRHRHRVRICHRLRGANANGPLDVDGLSGLDDATKLVGEGRISHAPQYIELTIQIRSECFQAAATPLASSATSTARTLCEGTFQKTSTIVMKSSRVAGFSRDYREIQQLVHSGSLRKRNTSRSDTPITFTVLGKPVRRRTTRTSKGRGSS